MKFQRFALTTVIFAALMPVPTARAAQDGLVADTEIHGPVLTFDWPDIAVGVGAYEEGPTGLTVIRFQRTASRWSSIRVAGRPAQSTRTRFALATMRRAWMPSCSQVVRPAANKPLRPS